MPSIAASPLAGGIDGVETILFNGDPANRIDLVFVGDGYLQDELAAYAPRCLAAMEELFDEVYGTNTGGPTDEADGGGGNLFDGIGKFIDAFQKL